LFHGQNYKWCGYVVERTKHPFIDKHNLLIVKYIFNYLTKVVDANTHLKRMLGHVTCLSLYMIN